METETLWALLRDRGDLAYGWWYDGMTLVAALIAGGTFWLACYTLSRREESVLALLRWLTPSTIPAILVLPSYYASITLSGALGWMWESPPQRAQDLSDETLRLIADNLDALALLGFGGTTVAFVILGILMLRLRFGPLGSQNLRQQPGKQEQTDDTEVFGPRPGEVAPGDLRPIEQKYGVLKVRRGTRKENHFSIFPNALIGKKGDANIIIPDKIVLREHAAFLIDGDQTLIVDRDSKNGTYIKRAGPDPRTIRVASSPVALQHEDLIYLGHPEVKEAVEILFLHEQAVTPAVAQQ